jgi:hypothetical protein
MGRNFAGDPHRLFDREIRRQTIETDGSQPVHYGSMWENF